MDKHTMHVLKDVSAHKEAIIQKVQQQIQQEPYPSKQLWPYRALAVMMTCSILLFIAWQASKPFDHLTTEILHEEEKQSFTDLFQIEVEGTETTFSQYLQIADELHHRENIKFYEPLQGFEAMQAVATTMGDAVHLIDPKNLPFKSNIQEVYAVTSEMRDGSLQKLFQFTYKEKSLTGVDRQYINFTVTNVDHNPLVNYKFKDSQDFSGEIKNVGLSFMNPLYFRAMTPDKGFAYSYYYYDAAGKRIYQISTRANEFYTYYNGYVYQIGYQLNGDQQEAQEKMVAIAREFIPHINSANAK
ncbi:hypothetical protein B1B04_04545 [Lysinibacillus sp. KCTC 33748]|uniref:hypothetical protein n=2 Tax=Lysinibacillus TaxID=400634 RepID=UPI0009A728C6|nr:MULTISPECIES: hypothetical protein [unclassified Lysinibacillus]OXS76259.1 hypothetical protein B1B04_04545 [Lysinibacillus sp. KCTC 33748]SKB43113.1 hypothetical protein SAMN06295926_102386 [Lysinibacillus sp. AC-3]